MGLKTLPSTCYIPFYSMSVEYKNIHRNVKIMLRFNLQAYAFCRKRNTPIFNSISVLRLQASLLNIHKSCEALTLQVRIFL